MFNNYLSLQLSDGIWNTLSAIPSLILLLGALFVLLKVFDVVDDRLGSPTTSAFLRGVIVLIAVGSGANLVDYCVWLATGIYFPVRPTNVFILTGFAALIVWVAWFHTYELPKRHPKKEVEEKEAAS